MTNTPHDDGRGYVGFWLLRPKEIFMFRSYLLSLSLALLPSTGIAATVFAVQSIICSSTQSSSLDGPVTLICSGDFSLNGGVLSDDNSILLSSTGALTLDNLTISAPHINLVAGSSISIGSGVSLVTSSTPSMVGAVSITVGATISLGTPSDARILTSNDIAISANAGSLSPDPGDPLSLIPIPASFTLFLSGLLGIMGLPYFRRKPE